MKNTRSVMANGEKLSIKKSIKLLKDMLIWSIMAMWIIFLTVLLSSSANAQNTQLDWDKPVRIENKEYTLIDIDEMGRVTVGYKEYNSNGNLITTGRYYNQKPDGKWAMYNDAGDMVSKAIYVNGEMRSHQFLNGGRMVTIRYKAKREEFICLR
jgi:hypothetical protein